jgi:hypothetical protein
VLAVAVLETDLVVLQTQAAVVAAAKVGLPVEMVDLVLS